MLSTTGLSSHVAPLLFAGCLPLYMCSRWGGVTICVLHHAIHALLQLLFATPWYKISCFISSHFADGVLLFIVFCNTSRHLIHYRTVWVARACREQFCHCEHWAFLGWASNPISHLPIMLFNELTNVYRLVACVCCAWNCCGSFDSCSL